MNKTCMKFAFAAGLTTLASLGSPTLAMAQTASYDIDPSHSAVQFSVKHLGISTVRGAFTKVSGTIALNDKEIAQSKVEATIDTTTVDTRDEHRDGHLKSPDFFDVAKFPTAMFVAKKIVKTGAGTEQMVGDLTLHGVTKEIALDVTGPTAEQKDPQGNIRRGFSATGHLNRRDYGLVWGGNLASGDAVVSDDVKIELDVEAVKKK